MGDARRADCGERDMKRRSALALIPAYGLPSGITSLGKVLICLVQKWVFRFAKMTDRSRRLTYPRGDVDRWVAADAGSLSRDLQLVNATTTRPLRCSSLQSIAE